MTIIGTHHFVSRESAVKYYKEYYYSRKDVDRKIADGEISVGKPTLKPGQTLSIIDNGTRYAITDPA